MKKLLLFSFALMICIVAANESKAQGFVYYEQMLPDESLGYPSYYPQEVEAPVTQPQVADNFTVPAGESWEIKEVELYGSDFGKDLLWFDLFIYESELMPFDEVLAITWPGEVFEQQSGLAFEKIPGDNDLFRVFLNDPISVPEGEYWISLVAQPDYSDNGGPTDIGGFFWTRYSSPADNPDGSAFISCGSNWCGTPDPYDYTFRLRSPARDAIIPLSDFAIFLGIGLILIFTLFTLRRFRA